MRNVKVVNEKTVELLTAAILCIDKLIANVDVNLKENDCNENVDFLFEMNEHQFEVQRCIMCRICLVNIYDQFIVIHQ